MTKRVLFTRGLSAVAQALRGVPLDMKPGEFELHASYTQRLSIINRFADHFHFEPEVGDDEFVGWLLDLCAKEAIDVVWPQSYKRALLRQRERLEASGVRFLLPVPDVETFDELDDKALFLSRLDRQEPDLPQAKYRVIRTAAEYRAAANELNTLYPGMRLCIKPSKGIYGAGFRIIDDSKSPFSRWLSNDTMFIGSHELETLLESNTEGREFLLMEFLAGTERSLDCLSDNGELVVCMTRHKGPGRTQEIEYHAPSIELARRLCRRFKLHGVINIQSRERLLPSGEREACVLEINPRMSGGVDMCRAAGVNLPLAALRLAAGTLSGPAPELLGGVTYVGWLQEGCKISA
jgi:biotin carboxylase